VCVSNGSDNQHQKEEHTIAKEKITAVETLRKSLEHFPKVVELIRTVEGELLTLLSTGARSMAPIAMLSELKKTQAQIDAFLDLMRIYHNEPDHPIGNLYGRDDALINLQMSARYLENLHTLFPYASDECLLAFPAMVSANWLRLFNGLSFTQGQCLLP
jgi:hypothetical protein